MHTNCCCCCWPIHLLRAFCSMRKLFYTHSRNFRYNFFVCLFFFVSIDGYRQKKNRIYINKACSSSCSRHLRCIAFSCFTSSFVFAHKSLWLTVVALWTLIIFLAFVKFLTCHSINIHFWPFTLPSYIVRAVNKSIRANQPFLFTIIVRWLFPALR